MSEAPVLPTPVLPGVDTPHGPAAGPPAVAVLPAPPPFAPPTASMSTPGDAPALLGGLTIPSLPPVGAGTSSPAPTPGPTPPPPVNQPADSSVPSPPPTRSPKPTRSHKPKIVKLLALALLAAAGGFAYITYSNSSDEGAVEVSDPATVDAPRPTSPLVAPIFEAQELVDGINDRPEVADALSELGLDSTGASPASSAETVPDGGEFSVVDALTFTYTVTRSTPAGTSMTTNYVINAESGDFSRVRDGIELRRIDGVLSERLPDRAGWILADDAAAPVEPLGVNGVPLTSDALPIEMSPYIVSSQDDGIVGASLVLDLAGYRAGEPASWQAWANRWELETQPDPADGMLRLFVKQQRNGALHRVSISSELDGWTVDYELTSWLSGAVPLVLN